MVKFIQPQRGRRPPRRATSPLLGTQFTGTVFDLTSRGQAVVRHDSGLLVFVSGAWLDEIVLLRIMEVKQNTAQAKLVDLLSPHPERVAPPCPWHGFDASHCGGCAWQFMAYSAQLVAKQRRVQQQLQRLSKACQCLPIVPSPDPWHYRHRAQLKSDGERLGFMAHSSRALVDLDECVVLTPQLTQHLKNLRTTLPNVAWRPERTELTTIDIDETHVSINKRLPFQQANTAQNLAMQQWLARKLANFHKAPVTLELFAGSGNFTQVLSAAGVTELLACEAVAEATDALSEKHLPGVSVRTCDLFAEEAVKALAAEAQCVELLVLDPPRDGFKHLPLLVERLPLLNEILYISCDLATFCRDVDALLARGFHCAEVQPLDLFPQTPHVELQARLLKPSRR